MTLTEEPNTVSKPKTAKKKGPKKRGKRTAESGGVNKSEFIRATPGSAKEVVAAAKAKGIKLTEAFVYAVRSAAKKKSAPKKRGPGRPKGSVNKTKVTKTKGTASGGAHHTWIAQAFEMGLDKAIKALTAIRDAVG